MELFDFRIRIADFFDFGFQIADFGILEAGRLRRWEGGRKRRSEGERFRRLAASELAGPYVGEPIINPMSP